MDLEWTQLRTFKGSQRLAFEELCCQLAHYEGGVPSGSTFYRKGAPDAGVECYWALPGGDEWAWQAKFFTSPPDDKQWGQIDGSIKTALKKHPSLIRYTVCLPIDRTDPRKPDEQWMMDKWKKHEKKWRDWAAEKRMKVEFLYWGEHEILERLSRSEHHGRCYFWFHQDLLTSDWLQQT